ncbi:alpha-D-xyloside xylohydrolase [Georgenia satyanarayanai]|uniref:Alpha-D-xyloside xylohydrolase n=1 Tax=Georgenia satyanarayanai TaxID=860221 RepID=A0A2Y9AFX7_9MICO|nr:TIM-barrel domain-containing protein [Georgenia satyanarayanai]PYF99293.1 alpha-D-xyloside xylohydrolase [Georgenia satyanarayanai]SSA43105.1 alpha-D-xyloside xylohydrolase [Georgenia satyanarayanai]
MFREHDGALVWRGGGETLRVEPWGEHSVRVRAALQRDVLDADHALLPPPRVAAEVRVEGPTATVTNGRIRVVATASTGDEHVVGYPVHRCHLAFYNDRGELLLEELDAGGSLRLRARDLRPHLGGDLAVTAAFAADPDEKLYGMGQYQQDDLDLKGCTFELAHRNSQASVPFVLSDRGYGFLWHNPAVGTATFGRNRTEWRAGVTDQLDYWITAGDTPAQISATYTAATGRVPMMPEYGLGFWQSKLRYWNQDQLLGVVREHVARGLPLDVVVADFFHWPHMGDFRFEEEFWPDPAAMVAELQEHGVELMVSVWPQVGLGSENFAHLVANNLLVGTERGIGVQMAFEEPSMFLDVTNPEARDFLWDTCRRNYGDLGVRLFWLDEAEPEYGVYDFDNYRYHLGPNVKVGNLYPQLFSRAFYEGQRAAGQEQVVNLVRCAWAGSQRYGALAWSGDISSTFADLRRQITAGIHMGVAGIAWFTTDIGGFHLGDVDDEAFRELFVRWFQFGTFCPVMRVHGDRLPYEDVTAGDGSRRLRSGGPNELWSYGDEVYPVLERYVHLREALRPYTRQVMETAHREGQPVMRGLFHDFPDDARAWDVGDQFLLGPDVLVAPVVVEGARSRDVYLPAGSRWTDAATGTEHDGGRWVSVDAPLDVVPVFLRDGALPHLVGRTAGARTS